jgi:hypothetical protein
VHQKDFFDILKYFFVFVRYGTGRGYMVPYVVNIHFRYRSVLNIFFYLSLSRVQNPLHVFMDPDRILSHSRAKYNYFFGLIRKKTWFGFGIFLNFSGTDQIQTQKGNLFFLPFLVVKARYKWLLYSYPVRYLYGTYGI